MRKAFSILAVIALSTSLASCGVATTAINIAVDQVSDSGDNQDPATPPNLGEGTGNSDSDSDSSPTQVQTDVEIVEVDEPTDLTKHYREVTDSTETWVEAVIEGDRIRIFGYLPERDGSLVYWAGILPEGELKGKVTAKIDREVETSSQADSAPTKDFTFDGDKVSFNYLLFGTRTDVTLETLSSLKAKDPDIEYSTKGTGYRDRVFKTKSYQAKITDVREIEPEFPREGEKLIGVFFDFTNLTDTTMPVHFDLFFDTMAFFDDGAETEADYGYAPEYSELRHEFGPDLAPGVTESGANFYSVPEDAKEFILYGHNGTDDPPVGRLVFPLNEQSA